MPITLLKAPTLTAVERTICAFEKEFKIDSNKFEQSEQAFAAIPDGAAEQWTYALEQRRALLSRVNAVCAHSYWKTTTGSRTRDSERPNYAERVAA